MGPTLCTEPVAPGPQPPSEQPRARLLEALQRQLHVELKVKQGAENMTHTYAHGTPKVRLPAAPGLLGGCCPSPYSERECSWASEPLRETQA